MDKVTEGQDVVVADRRHYLSYEEGKVVRAEPDKFGRVRVHFPNADDAQDWHAVELFVLGPVAKPGERYRWTDRAGAPFTVGERFAGMFRILHDDATTEARSRGWTGRASAAELVNWAEPVTTPAPDVSTLPLADRMRRWADDGMPRPMHDGSQVVRDFADEVEALQARADGAAK